MYVFAQLTILLTSRRLRVQLVHCSKECTPPYLFPEITYLLQPVQAEGMLGRRSMYKSSWIKTVIEEERVLTTKDDIYFTLFLSVLVLPVHMHYMYRAPGCYFSFL
jgi:hypothetical protein